jgi:biopolymer transport protein ExbD
MPNWDVLLVADGKQLSNVDESEIRRMLAANELASDDCLRRVGETRWRRVAELKGKTEAEPEVKPVPATRVAAAMHAAAERKEEEEEVASWGRHTEVEPVDMTPMVDVVVLLLLFFMVTASYSLQKILEIPKPSSEKNRASMKSRSELMKEYIILEIDGRNQMLVEDEPLRGRKLPEAIKTAMTETGKTKLLIIADGGSYHGSTVRAIDAGNEVGVAQPIAFSVRSDE